MKLGTDKSNWSKRSLKTPDSGDVSDHPYQNQLQALLDAIDAGEEMPLTDMETALRTHRVVFAADESARTGQSVNL